MAGSGEFPDEIPEDVIEDLMEAEEELREPQRAKRKKRYPSTRDIAEAVRAVALMYRGGDPSEFPERVLEYLEEQGFYVGHVTEKRIWRTYETLVRRRVIPDTLGVVEW